MKLVILDQFSDPGGAQQGLLDLLCELCARRSQVLVGLPGDGVIFDRVRELGFETERIECGPFRSGRKSIGDAARFLFQKRRLTEHIRGMLARTGSNLLYVNGPRLMPAAPCGIPVVFHAHSYIGPGPVRGLIGRALARTQARLIANCEFVAHPWRRFVPDERVHIVYNGVDRAGTVAPRAEPHAPVVACIGRIAPEKGQLEFVAAARVIHGVIPDARFAILGAPLFAEPGAARYDRAVRAAAIGLPIEFPGWVADIPAALADIDLLLAPSAPHEATTRVILESYAAGVPVIAFRSGGIPEVIEEDATGLLVSSAEEMGQLAIDLLRSPARREEMSRAAEDCWRRRFTLERCRREVADLLERAAG